MPNLINLQAQEKLGPVDMLVNCAGMSLAGKFEDLEVSTFEVSKNLFFHCGSPIHYEGELVYG